MCAEKTVVAIYAHMYTSLVADPGLDYKKRKKSKTKPSRFHVN